MDKHNKNKQELKKQLKKNKNTRLKNYAQFSGIAFQMIAVICLFAFLGNWLDGKYPNTYSMYAIIFSLLGVIIAMYLVIKQVTSMNKDN